MAQQNGPVDPVQGGAIGANAAGVSSSEGDDEAMAVVGPSDDELIGAARVSAAEAESDGDVLDEPQVDSSGRRLRGSRFWLDLLEGRATVASVAEELASEIRARVERTDDRLKAQLAGTTELVIKGTSKSFHLDGKTWQWKDGAASASDCSLLVSEGDLLRIAAGDLNPQLGMLSGKVVCKGSSSLGVYFFSLIAPKSFR